MRTVRSGAKLNSGLVSMLPNRPPFDPHQLEFERQRARHPLSPLQHGRSLQTHDVDQLMVVTPAWEASGETVAVNSKQAD
jgi:hypothetical protein